MAEASWLEESLVPRGEGFQLHQDSVEFIDTDGTLTGLPFSRIARSDIDEDDTLGDSLRRRLQPHKSLWKPYRYRVPTKLVA